MCRLFGLIANKQVDIRFSMLEAYENLKKQGKENPHGWGIGWYENSNPMVKKHGENAFYSREFDNLVAEVHSKVFIAHVRYASSGSANSEKNAHPFVYENWVFAHNGTIDRERIQSFLRKPFNENYTSEPIDSEVYFRFILQHIYQNNDVIEAIRNATREVIKDANGANFLLSNGEDIYAYKYGKPLFYLFRNPELLSKVSEETAALIESKVASHEKAIIIATERLTESEDWKEIDDRTLFVFKNNLEYKKIVL